MGLHLSGSTVASLSNAFVGGNVIGLGVKGDVKTVTDAAITSGQATLSSTSAAFTSADVGKVVQVIGAGTPTNDRGAWAAFTAYAINDRVTFGGDTYIAPAAFTSGASFAIGNWTKWPANSATLATTISSVTGGVATLAVTAGTTVSGATCIYGTDDSAAVAALPAGNYYFPGGRTYFLADWYVPSHTSVTFGGGVTFRLPDYRSTDLSVFRLHTSDRTLTSSVEDIHLGSCDIDGSALTPPTGTVPRGITVLNAKDWSIETVRGIGLPGPTGNLLQTGANTGLAAPSNGRVKSLRNTAVRGLGSSAVQHTGGTDIHYGTLVADGGVPFRVETDGNATYTDNITCELAHASNESKFGNSAVYLVAHNHAIRNVRVDNLLAEGGCDGLFGAYDTGGSVTDCTIRSGRVTGGGRATNFPGNDFSFPGLTIENLRVDGAVAAPSLRSVAGGLGGVGFAVAPGVIYRNCRATNSADRGFYDIAVTSGIVAGSLATFIGCEAVGNVGPGFEFRATQKVVMLGGQVRDAIAGATPINAQMLGATQNSGTLAGWFAGSGASSVSGSGGVLTVTAAGGQTTAAARTATGTSGIAVTANHYYKVSATGAVGTTPAGSRVTVTFQFYKSDGSASATTPPGSTAVAMPTTGVYYVQAPSDAAFATVLVKFLSNVGGQNLTAGWTATFSGLTMQEVTGVPTQTYGVLAGTGVAVDYYGSDLATNAAGATAGTGTITAH